MSTKPFSRGEKSLTVVRDSQDAGSNRTGISGKDDTSTGNRAREEELGRTCVGTQKKEVRESRSRENTERRVSVEGVSEQCEHESMRESPSTRGKVHQEEGVNSVQDLTEIQQMVLDEVLQQEQHSLLDRLINVPVDGSKDTSMLRERNPNVMMPRGKIPSQQAKSGKKRWSRLKGKENVDQVVCKEQDIGIKVLGQKRQWSLRDEEESQQEVNGAKKICPEQLVDTEGEMCEVVVANLQWPQPYQ